MAFEKNISTKDIKSPPHAIEAERAVLGSLMIDPEAWESVSDILSADNFHLSQHQITFSFMLKLVAQGQPLDIVTLSEKLDKDAKLDKINSVITKIYPFLLVVCLFLIIDTFSIDSGNLIDKIRTSNGQFIAISTFMVCLALYIKVVIRPDYFYKDIEIHSFIKPLFITGILIFNYMIFISNKDRSIHRIIYTIIACILVIGAEVLTSEDLETSNTGHILATISYLMICLNNSLL